MSPAMTNTIEGVVAEHAEEAAFLWLQRAAAVHQPQYAPDQFAALDEQLEAQVDGLRVAADDGWKVASAGLDAEGPEDFFAPAVLAIESLDQRWAGILERAQTVPDAAPGVVSALGWVEPKFLNGRVKDLLAARSAFHQMLGIAACAVHRRDPEATLDRFLTSPAPIVRSRALRTAGELGRLDLLQPLLAALSDQKKDVRFWAAWSAVMLGDRSTALDTLIAHAMEPGPRQLRSLQLALQTIPMDRGHDLLTELSRVADADRLRIIGSGFVGSVRYVPWLLEQMTNPVLARVAGEAFVNITGADFNLDQLEAMPPEDFEDGPTDDPADENVEVPDDVALPWPDVARVKAWWGRNSSRFEISTRYFLGAPLNSECCKAALKTGFQRQRVAAAHHLSLLAPGTPLFNTSAPAWRQQRWIEQLER